MTTTKKAAAPKAAPKAAAPKPAAASTRKKTAVVPEPENGVTKPANGQAAAGAVTTERS